MKRHLLTVLAFGLSLQAAAAQPVPFADAKLAWTLPWDADRVVDLPP